MKKKNDESQAADPDIYELVQFDERFLKNFWTMM